jgi:hypothetical protein
MIPESADDMMKLRVLCLKRWKESIRNRVDSIFERFAALGSPSKKLQAHTPPATNVDPSLTFVTPARAPVSILRSFKDYKMTPADHYSQIRAAMNKLGVHKHIDLIHCFAGDIIAELNSKWSASVEALQKQAVQWLKKKQSDDTTFQKASRVALEHAYEFRRKFLMTRRSVESIVREHVVAALEGPFSTNLTVKPVNSALHNLFVALQGKASFIFASIVLDVSSEMQLFYNDVSAHVNNVVKSAIDTAVVASLQAFPEIGQLALQMNTMRTGMASTVPSAAASTPRAAIGRDFNRIAAGPLLSPDLASRSFLKQPPVHVCNAATCQQGKLYVEEHRISAGRSVIDGYSNTVQLEYKIGFSETHARNLNTSEVSTPFSRVATFKCNGAFCCRKLEHVVHALWDKLRSNARKEFFVLPRRYNFENVKPSLLTCF